ncbi:hypothetical protein L596_018131 [Steinernema carpocapsae]|uniref:CWH43-like N-terminal domain-containing protein n=1 Tax=Steinernema carpocapsae TaxID=34508 RepID=A0A4U5N3R3_STECR|nr:hypothetical protein L596_018131 [Steinernema carpocapsae]
MLGYSQFSTSSLRQFYAIGVANGDHYAWLPYISDGGAVPPQSCIFSQFMNLHAFFTAIIAYLRHHQYIEFYARSPSFTVHWRRFSIAAMISSFAMAVGLTIAGNFQEGKITLWWHNFGAFLAFLSAIFYCWCQVILDYKMKPRMTPLWLNHTRTVFITGGTIALIIHFVCLFAQPFVPEGAPERPALPESGIELFKPSNPHYLNHIMSTFWEWVLVILIEALIASFAWELREFDVEVKVTRKDEFRNQSSYPKTTSSKNGSAESDRRRRMNSREDEF